MGFNDSITLNGYKVVCQSYSQDSNPNYDTDYALLDVYRGDKFLTHMTPERRFYIASQTPDTKVAIHSTLAGDLYIVFEGKSPDSGRPIIKIFLNPLVNWLWIGVLIVIVGTFLALVPPLQPATRKVTVPVPSTNLGAPGPDSRTWVGAAQISATPEAPHV